MGLFYCVCVILLKIIEKQENPISFLKANGIFLFYIKDKLNLPSQIIYALIQFETLQ